MKTSFSTLACPEWSMAQVLEAAAKYGFDGVELRVISRELDLWKLPDFHRSALTATRKRIGDLGLRVVCLGSSACFHSPEAAERRRNIDSALRMAELAADLGAPSIRVFPDRIQSGCSRSDTVGWIVESAVELAQNLQSSGVQVWLETHGDFAGTAAVDEILRRAERNDLGVLWDPANAFCQSGEMPTLSPNMAPRLRHVHVKDVKLDAAGEVKYVLTGDGDFPISTMLDVLKAVRYQGFVSFEWERQWHPELAPPNVALPHFMRWWKSREEAR